MNGAVYEPWSEADLEAAARSMQRRFENARMARRAERDVQFASCWHFEDVREIYITDLVKEFEQRARTEKGEVYS
jgi:hypothetical protein